jgi:hypothetical protein
MPEWRIKIWLSLKQTAKNIREFLASRSNYKQLYWKKARLSIRRGNISKEIRDEYKESKARFAIVTADVTKPFVVSFMVGGMDQAIRYTDYFQDHLRSAFQARRRKKGKTIREKKILRKIHNSMVPILKQLYDFLRSMVMADCLGNAHFLPRLGELFEYGPLLAKEIGSGGEDAVSSKAYIMNALFLPTVLPLANTKNITSLFDWLVKYLTRVEPDVRDLVWHNIKTRTKGVPEPNARMIGQEAAKRSEKN